MCKDTCHQVSDKLSPETHLEERELILVFCPLTSTYVLWSVCEPHDSSIQISALLFVSIRGGGRRKDNYKETKIAY